MTIEIVTHQFSQYVKLPKVVGKSGISQWLLNYYMEIVLKTDKVMGYTVK